MKNNLIKIGVLYIIGIGINFIPVIFTYFVKIDHGSENWTFLIYLILFFFSFLFYIPYFCLTIKNLTQTERSIFLFSPCFLYFALIVIYVFSEGGGGFALLSNFLMLTSPFIILNFIYALYLELTFRKNLKQKRNSNKFLIL